VRTSPRRGHGVRDGAVACLLTAQPRLTSGEVHPESTSDSLGWRRARRARVVRTRTTGGGEAEEGPGTAAFAGEEGAPMGGDGRCGVLRHRCRRGKMKLASIWER
jgi:hypothetical protein